MLLREEAITPRGNNIRSFCTAEGRLSGALRAYCVINISDGQECGPKPKMCSPLGCPDSPLHSIAHGAYIVRLGAKLNPITKLIRHTLLSGLRETKFIASEKLISGVFVI